MSNKHEGYRIFDSFTYTDKIIQTFSCVLFLRYVEGDNFTLTHKQEEYKEVKKRKKRYSIGP